MVRMLNLVVLSLNIIVLFLGQLPAYIKEMPQYREFVYMLIIFSILLLLTDIFQWIASFILSFTKMRDNSYSLSALSSVIGLSLALMVSTYMRNIPSINKLFELIH